MGYLGQLKAISFLAGLGTAGALYLSTNRLIWRSTTDITHRLPGAVPAPSQPEQEAEPIFGLLYRAYLVRKWNEGVDAVFKPVIEGLSKRNL